MSESNFKTRGNNNYTPRGRGGNTRGGSRGGRGGYVPRDNNRDSTRTYNRDNRDSNFRGNPRGNTRGAPSRGRGDSRNPHERGYGKYVSQNNALPQTIYYVFDDVNVPNRNGNVNLKQISVNELSESDRLRIIQHANDIIDNFTVKSEESNSE